MTPHPRCKRWLHSLRSECHQCELRREVDAIQEDAHRDFMRRHFPESYRRFNRPALKVVRGDR